MTAVTTSPGTNPRVTEEEPLEAGYLEGAAELIGLFFFRDAVRRHPGDMESATADFRRTVQAAADRGEQWAIDLPLKTEE